MLSLVAVAFSLLSGEGQLYIHMHGPHPREETPGINFR